MIDIVMPQLGLSMTEGTVISYTKELGAFVDQGEMLYMVETDKVEMEVESPHSGYLAEIVVPPGQLVPVGTVIARLSEQPKS